MNTKLTETDSENEETDYQSDDAYKGFALVLIVAAIICFFVVLHNQPAKSSAHNALSKVSGNSGHQAEDPKEYWSVKGTIGDFTAGVAGTLFSFAGFVLLYLSLKKQSEANVMQQKAFNHDKIEGRFFELLKLHRDNVSDIKYSLVKREKITNEKGVKEIFETNIFESRHFFLAALEQFEEAYNELSHMFYKWPLEEIYTSEYLLTLKKNKEINTRNIDLLEYARIDIIYLIVFFGVSKSGIETVKSLTHNRYDLTFMSYILAFAALKPQQRSVYWTQWDLTNKLKPTDLVTLRFNLANHRLGKEVDANCFKQISVIDGKQTMLVNPYYPDKYEKYYGGHQFRLGHYFRHLYQTISFIDSSKELSSNEMYGYIRHLRGQLSTAEQILIFLNSLSQLGRIWELEEKKHGSAMPDGKQLITKYMIIKNIPNDVIFADIRISDYYPNVVFEGFDVPENKIIKKVTLQPNKIQTDMV